MFGVQEGALSCDFETVLKLPSFWLSVWLHIGVRTP